MGWTAEDVPDLSDRTIIVTGANSGLGFETVRAVARRGARTLLACRNPEKAQGALDAVRAESPQARVEAAELDLTSLVSVRKSAAVVLGTDSTLAVLVHTAGVMAIPRRTTADGFEMQLGTNHLGHFALTGLLLERLLAMPGSRVVNVSSTAHKMGRMHFDDLQLEAGYGKWKAYGQSKLANLLFTYELQRRLGRAGAGTIAVACHPGYSATNLQAVGPQMSGSSLMERTMEWMNRLFSQSADMGALPTLYAAAALEVHGGDYFGPDGFAETWGHPKKVTSARASHDETAAARLWEISEELTGVRYAPLS